MPLRADEFQRCHANANACPHPLTGSAGLEATEKALSSIDLSAEEAVRSWQLLAQLVRMLAALLRPRTARMR